MKGVLVSIDLASIH